MTTTLQRYEVQVEHNVPVPMRDGTLLRAEVYRPKAEGKWPVIVQRDGYDHLIDDYLTLTFAEFFSQRGYVYVINNTRGTEQSEGVFFVFIDDGWGENQDGYDTIEWAAQQPWSDGKVGMYGTSYACCTQYLAAPSRPPSLRACVPIFGTSSYATFAFPRGIYHLQWHQGWAVFMAHEMASRYPQGLKTTTGLLHEEPAAISARLEKVQQEIEQWHWHLPFKEFPPLKDLLPWYFEHLSHPAGDPWWDQTDARLNFAETDVPMLHIAGWYDESVNAAIDTFTGLVSQGRSERCRSGQRLVIGPWIHHDKAIPPPPLDFTSNAYINFQEAALQWFDYWLKGEENGVSDDPAVRIFLMGENRWLEMDQWPPADITLTPFYLRQGSGKSEQSLNGGRLTVELPAPDELSDSYLYDPTDPVIAHAVLDSTQEVLQQDREGRMLTYSSEPLQQPLTVVGVVKAMLHASSSAPDTDWFVRLCDVLPDGTSVKVCGGMMRARYRNSLERQELMEPGQSYLFEIEMTATAQTFLAGHRIRLQVTSSAFPNFDRNLNTGGPFGEESVGQVAINTIYYDAQWPSHLLLPLMKSP